MFAWDVKQILDFFKEKFGDNDQLPNKELTLKVTILLTLTTSYRISNLYILDLNHMIKKANIINLGFTSCISFGEGINRSLD